MRAQFRHVMAVAAGMLPLMALFVYLMSFRRSPIERPPYHRLSLIFLAAGMVALMFYAWARAEKFAAGKNRPATGSRNIATGRAARRAGAQARSPAHAADDSKGVMRPTHSARTGMALILTLAAIVLGGALALLMQARGARVARRTSRADSGASAHCRRRSRARRPLGSCRR